MIYKPVETSSKGTHTPAAMATQTADTSSSSIVDQRPESILVQKVRQLAKDSRVSKPVCSPQPQAKQAVVQRLKFNNQGNVTEVAESWEDDEYDTDDQQAFTQWVNSLDPNEEVLGRVYQALSGLPNPDRNEAIAKSTVSLKMSSLQNVVPENDMSRIPKDQWWKLFIDKGLHNAQDNATNALRFDHESSPGYYAAMMASFGEHVANAEPGNRQVIDAQRYKEMHDEVSVGTLKAEDNHYIPMPTAYSGNETSFGVLNSSDMDHTDALKVPSLTGFREMVQEGTLGYNTAATPNGVHDPGAEGSSISKFDFKARQAHQPDSNSLLSNIGGRFSATTNYPSDQAPERINAVLQTYYQEVSQVVPHEQPEAMRNRKLRAIVKVIRALHVGHFFQDANGRLNTMTLLNKFLIEENFKPVIMDDTAIFGGGFSIDQLVGQAVRGMRAFAAEAGIEEGTLPLVPVRRSYGDAQATHFVFEEEMANPAGQGMARHYTLSYAALENRAAIIVHHFVQFAVHRDGNDNTGKLYFTDPHMAERLERQLEAQVL